MRLADFALYRYTVPFVTPIRFAGATLDSREGALIRLRDTTGLEGWGEASPLPGFSPETLEQALDDLFTGTSSITGDEVAEPPRDEPNLVPSARFGLETAILNLRAAFVGRTLPEMMSANPRGKVEMTALLSGAPEDVLRDAARARDAGYRAVKLKVGGRAVEEDADTVREVAAMLGGDVMLRLDANRAWCLEEALEFQRLTRGLDRPMEYLEEPLADPASLPDFVAKTATPVALDETLVGMPPERLKDHRYARAVVLKPTLLGLSRALRFAGEATRLGMTTVVSSAYETGVGTAALVALAAAVGEAPAGLDTYRRLAEDVVSPRLALSGPELDVREFFAVRRAVDGAGLEPIRERAWP